MASLQAANKNPYGAAEVLEDALASQAVSQTATTYRRLFEFWLQAREQERARKALQRAARLSGDIDLYLYLAQLQMEEQEFDSMYQTMLQACGKPLPDKYVGRANLLLGVSQLKLGDEAAARRSFINATLIGGVNAQAAQWLRFMNGPPATEDEISGIEGICYGVNDKPLQAARNPVVSNVETAVDSPAADGPSKPFEIKTVAPMSLYYLQSTKPLEETMASLKGTLIKLYVSLAKSGGSADGPLQIILTGDPRSDAGVEVELGAPFRGSVSGSGRFGVRSTQPFKCASTVFEGKGEALAAALAQLAEAVQEAQLEFTGETRIVVPQGNSADTLKAELQIGIR